MPVDRFSCNKMVMNPKEIGQLVRAAREARGLSQVELSRLIGIKQASLHSVETGETRRSKFLPEIVRELGIPPDDVGLPPDVSPDATVMPVDRLVLPGRDFPIYASVEGGAGEIIRSTDPVDWHPRPAPVAHVKTAYGLIVVGESMIPEFDPGDIALVNPILPAMAMKPCIFYAEKHGEARASIKRFLRANADKWLVYQHNPPRGGTHEFSLSRKEWGICHRVIGKHYPQ
jgi:transcriptional regulator with XRE-family HTH domain